MKIERGRLKIGVYAILLLPPPLAISSFLSLLSSSYSFSSSSQLWKSKPSKIVLRTTTQMQLKSTTTLLTLQHTTICPTPQIGVTRTLVEATPSNHPNLGDNSTVVV